MSAEDVMASSAAQTAVAKALRDVLSKVQRSAEKAGRAQPPRLVAVSKTKPVSLLMDAYNAGQRHFGENYVQELLDKAPQMPRDVHWHFIGHLQSNKAKALVTAVPNLYSVETVDSEKIANHLNRACEGAQRDEKLKVMVQVNTSGEETKYGIEPNECVDLAKHVYTECPNLRLAGLMTIGMLDYTSKPENFQMLMDCRQRVCRELDLPEDGLELSMGMSQDFEAATEMGSTNIRVGSSIFGARDYSQK